MMREHHWLSNKLDGRYIPDRGGHGLFAREFIPAGELLLAWGGDIRRLDEFDTFTPTQQMQCLMIEENLLLVSMDEGRADWINHSCDPNAWLVGQITIYSRRDIIPGEEVCFDYATCDSRPHSAFECGCEQSTCRKTFSGNDWMLPELQKRYDGHFMPYLQLRINRLKEKR
jgi:SET domain-containing protein